MCVRIVTTGSSAGKFDNSIYMGEPTKPNVKVVCLVIPYRDLRIR